MRHLRLLIAAIATICVIALGVFALVTRPPLDPADDDVIIIKGGSLTIQCPHASTLNANLANCMPFNSTDKSYEHKNGNGKIEQIVVKTSGGTVLKTFVRATDFSDGKPSVEITYK